MSENNRILIVDDNKSIHDDFMKILKSVGTEFDEIEKLERDLFKEENKHTGAEISSYRIDHAYQGEEALQMVEKAENEGDPYALVFMDVRMPPGMNGIETIARIWERDIYVEVVICTAYSDYSWDEIIAKLGSSDRLLYLKKPFNTMEVKQMALSLIKKWNFNCWVREHVSSLEKDAEERNGELKSLLKELEKANMELEIKNKILSEVAHRDNLTGLLNYGALFEWLSVVFSESRRHSYPFSVIIIDISSFAEINETHGTNTGNDILKKIAEIFKRTLREHDIKLRCTDGESFILQEELIKFGIAGRYGGDEFILVLPHCGKKEALLISKRLEADIGIMSVNGAEFTLDLNFGIAVLHGETACNDSRELVGLADKALSEAKSIGRNATVCYDFKG